MERYEKIRRPLTLAICILFVAGLILSFAGGSGAIGVIGNIVLILALIPAGVVWLMERKRQEKQDATGTKGNAAPTHKDENELQ